MNTEQDRAEFEAWYRLHHGSRDVYGRDASGEYVDKWVQGAFNVWQARAALAAQPVTHTDDAAVDRFAAAMKAKLAKKRAEGRSGWDDKAQCTGEFLSALLREHVDKGDPLDVGNLAMMLHQRGERISTQPAASASKEAHEAAPQSAAQPLTDEQINTGRQALPYDIEDKPEPWSFKEGVRFAERMHGIGVKND